jgi:hypothetical protein
MSTTHTNGNGAAYTPLDLPDDHPLLEAMREAARITLAEQGREFERELSLIKAQAAATLAELSTKVAVMEHAVAEQIAAVRSGTEGLTHEQALAEARITAAIAEMKSDMSAVKSSLECAVADKLATVRDGAPGTAGAPGVPGPKGDTGPAGHDGRLRTVTEWSGDVHHEGDLITRDGSLWQCIKATGHPPPYESWTCLARAGRDARSPRVCGTWESNEDYRALDIVAMNGGAFVATRDSPGECPGENWQLLARQGQRGIAGPKGDRGEKGERGLPAPLAIGWKIDKENYTVTPILAGGVEGPKLELRSLFKQFDDETHPPTS